MFAEIIINFKAPLGLFTYQIPPGLANNIKIGQIVEIDFRGKKGWGIIFSFKKDRGDVLKIKDISRIIDPNPIPIIYLELIKWISQYYAVSLSESLTAVLPEPPRKSLSETKSMASYDTKNEPTGSKTKAEGHSGGYNEPNTARNLPAGRQGGRGIRVGSILEEVGSRLDSESERAADNNYPSAFHPSGKAEGYSGGYNKQDYLIVGSKKKRWENYYKLIEKSKSNNKQTIACFSNMQDAKEFSDKLSSGINYGLFLSNLNKSEKYKVYTNSRGLDYDLICGVRSVVFLPMPNLKTIIIDEPAGIAHHSDQKPYLTTDKIAKWLGIKRRLNIVIGSPFPDLRDWHLFRQGKSKFINTGEVSKKKITLVDTSRNKELLNPRLLESISRTLDRNQKAFLFLPKLYSSQILRCLDCHEILECQKCRHYMNAEIEKLACPSCNYQAKIPVTCPKCQSVNLQKRGYSIVHLRNELENIFRGKYDNIQIGGLEELEYLKEGLFNLIGIVNLDFMLNVPSYNQEEKIYTLLTKMMFMGNEIILQTSESENPIFKNFLQKDIQSLLDKILQNRKKYGFPPFGKIAEITVGEKNHSDSIKKISDFIQKLNPNLEVYGPYEKPNYRKTPLSYHQITVKFSTDFQKNEIIKNLGKNFYYKEL